MNKILTIQQKRVFEFIKTRVAEYGFPPSIREIAQFMCLSTRAAYDHLRAIEKKGFIKRNPLKPRAIEIIEKHLPGTVKVPLVGQVSAGKPILAEENIEEILSFPEYLVKYDNLFALRIQGDSMVDAGIYDGDYVFVKPQPHAEVGEIVVVLLEDEATIKRFFKDNGMIRLEPANPNMNPIYVKDIRILGKVVGIFRRLD